MTDKQKHEEVWKAVFTIEYFGARKSLSVEEATREAAVNADKAKATAEDSEARKLS